MIGIIRHCFVGLLLLFAQFSSATLINLTSGGPAVYLFDPGDGSSVTLTITSNVGSIQQNGQGLGIDSAFADDNALDNYSVGASQETLTFTFSSLINLDSIELDNFEAIGDKNAEFAVDGGGILALDENNMTDLGLSNWRYDVNQSVNYFTIGTPLRSGIIGDTTFRINNLVASAVVPVPAAVWLLGSALIGLAGVKRKLS